MLSDKIDLFCPVQYGAEMKVSKLAQFTALFTEGCGSRDYGCSL